MMFCAEYFSEPNYFVEALLENERNAGTTAETTLVQMSNYLRVCFRSPDEKVHQVSLAKTFTMTQFESFRFCLLLLSRLESL